MVQIRPWAIAFGVGQTENHLTFESFGRERTLELEGGKFRRSEMGTTTFIVSRSDGSIVQHSLEPGEKVTDHGISVAVSVTRTLPPDEASAAISVSAE
jgi:hypothetical protein